jgi:hypothetical protein
MWQATQIRGKQSGHQAPQVSADWGVISAHHVWSDTRNGFSDTIQLAMEDSECW